MRLKKILAMMLATAMVAGTMTGCNSGKEEATTTAATEAADTTEAVEVKDVTLTVWGPQEDQAPVDGYDNGILAAMCEDFNEAHPEWNITFEYGVCGEDVAKDEVTKDVDAAADVYMYANDQLPILVEAGAIAKLGGDNLEAIKADTKALEEAFYPIAQKMYADASQGAPGAGPDMGGANFTGGAAGGADDVVDADYTVVDDDK